MSIIPIGIRDPERFFDPDNRYFDGKSSSKHVLNAHQTYTRDGVQRSEHKYAPCLIRRRNFASFCDYLHTTKRWEPATHVPKKVCRPISLRVSRNGDRLHNDAKDAEARKLQACIIQQIREERGHALKQMDRDNRIKQRFAKFHDEADWQRQHPDAFLLRVHQEVSWHHMM